LRRARDRHLAAAPGARHGDRLVHVRRLERHPGVTVRALDPGGHRRPGEAGQVLRERRHAHRRAPLVDGVGVAQVIGHPLAAARGQLGAVHLLLALVEQYPVGQVRLVGDRRLARRDRPGQQVQALPHERGVGGRVLDHQPHRVRPVDPDEGAARPAALGDQLPEPGQVLRVYRGEAVLVLGEPGVLVQLHPAEQFRAQGLVHGGHDRS
jgi:hypothetical protein